MRIALVIGRYHARGGGAERWTDQHARRLLERGHRVELLARSFTDPPAEAVCHAIDPRKAVTAAPRAWAPFSDRLGFASATAQLLARLDVDVVHDMGDGWRADLFMPHHGTRIGGFERNNALLPAPTRALRGLAQRWMPRYREFADLERLQYAPEPGKRFVALSNMVREHMIGHHQVPTESIRVVHNGVDIDRFRPPAETDSRWTTRRRLGFSGETVFLLVAHNYRLKGLDPLLRAFGRLLGAGHRVGLIVVGSGSTRRYRQLAIRLGCAHMTRFVGPQPDPLACYHAADVYAHPTYYDPCSLVVLEALACGLPVITTRHNGAGELLGSGIEGAVISEPDDVPALTERMGRYLDDDLRASASRAARAVACRNSLDRNFDALLSLYREATERRASSAA